MTRFRTLVASSRQSRLSRLPHGNVRVESRIQSELRGADDGVASGIAPVPGRGHGVSRGIRVEARRARICRSRPSGPRGSCRSQPVPGTEVSTIGVSGRPLPALSWLVIVHPLKSAPFTPVEQRPAGDTDAGRVLKLRRHEMTLIEIRRRPFGVEIQPILGDGAAARDRCRQRRRRRPSLSTACTAPSMSGRCEGGAATGTGPRAVWTGHST